MNFNFKWQISIDWLLIRPYLFMSIQLVWNFAGRLLGTQGSFLENEAKVNLCAKFDTTMPYMVQFYQLTIH